MSDLDLFATGFCFLFAGFIKRMIGLGLPTVSIALLGLIMVPAQAAALLVVPSLTTNLWQSATGGNLRPLLARLWPMLLSICAGQAIGTALLGGAVGGGSMALGLALLLYAGIALAAPRLAIPRRAEWLLGPLTGALTGAITAVTGVFVIPAVPYMQALGLGKESLVQGLGISFSVSTVALAASLAATGALPPTLAGASVLALAPAVLGMVLGRLVLRRVSPPVFRICFLVGLAALGLHLALRG